MTELMQVLKARHSVSEIDRAYRPELGKTAKAPPRGYKVVAFFNVQDRDTSSYHHVKTWAHVSDRNLIGPKIFDIQSARSKCSGRPIRSATINSSIITVTQTAPPFNRNIGTCSLQLPACASPITCRFRMGMPLTISYLP